MFPPSHAKKGLRYLNILKWNWNVLKWAVLLPASQITVIALHSWGDLWFFFLMYRSLQWDTCIWLIRQTFITHLTLLPDRTLSVSYSSSQKSLENWYKQVQDESNMYCAVKPHKLVQFTNCLMKPIALNH